MTRVFVALVLVLGVACSGGAGPRTVEITVRHSRYEPAAVAVERGQPVRFVIHNLDPIDHEFILGDRAVQDRHEDGTEPHHGAIPGEVSIPAGESAETTYAFGGPGGLLFGCHLPGHWDYGMRGTVTIG